MSTTFTRYDTAEYLKEEQDIIAYLEACMTDDEGDGKLIRIALGNIARVKNMSKLSRVTGLSRPALYKALSPDGNPEFSTICKVIRALGIDLHATKNKTCT